jgi:CubicO group peptidase (beta-lactamase class C family)
MRSLALPALLGLSLGALAAAYVTSAKARSVLNWTYFRRFVTYPRSRPVTSFAWYSPMERVEGGGGVFMRRLSRTDPLGANVRAELDTFARESQSDAVLVVRSLGPRHDPEVLYEYRAEHESPNVATDSNSMAKGPVGLLVGIAIAQGKISSVDDPVSRYLPEWADARDPRSKITISDLLQMSSGLRNQDSQSNPLSDLVVMHLGAFLEPFALSIPSVESPGVHHVYNNVNSQILTIVLERVYGERYSHLLSRLLWKSVAAWDAGLWLDHPGGLARTYCCLFARPHDWARIGLLLLWRGNVNGRQVVPADWIDRMISPSRTSPEFGSNIWLPKHDETYDAEGLYYLAGKSQQHVFVLPHQNVVIVRVGEKPKSWKWTTPYLPNLISRALPRR